MTRLTHEPNPFIAQSPHPHVPIKPLKFLSAQTSEKSSHRMSAFGYKQTYRGQLANVRFTPESGHSEAEERGGLKKRTLDVRFAPNSGHKWVWRGMSAYDP